MRRTQIILRSGSRGFSPVAGTECGWRRVASAILSDKRARPRSALYQPLLVEAPRPGVRLQPPLSAAMPRGRRAAPQGQEHDVWPLSLACAFHLSIRQDIVFFSLQSRQPVVDLFQDLYYVIVRYEKIYSCVYVFTKHYFVVAVAV